MDKDRLLAILTASGAVTVDGGKVDIDLTRMTGKWQWTGHGWQRDQDNEGGDDDADSNG